ncbi:MAG: hypothetical protein JWO82_1561, partial [Akkermansiaceae bacterium]|nr:hypothetical protein [Akkermansiaceae bacterium]
QLLCSLLGDFPCLMGADLMGRPDDLPATIQWIACDLNLPLPVEPSSFDVVTSSEVIEHLENSRAICREWFRVLRPGGTLILSTPNCESWRSLLSLVFQGHFAAFNHQNYPAHITALLQLDLRRILTEAGFKEISFNFVPSGGIPKLGRLTWQAISGGLLKGRRFSDNLVAVARKPAGPLG